MTKTVHVVGSGASAVHFAEAALDRGWRVVMFDVGRPRPTPELPGRSFLQVIDEHEDATRYFLGQRFQAATFPGNDGEYYGFPPHREYIFEGTPQYGLQSSGFSPLSSFAQGGLAEAWTAGCFPFNDGELSAFPFGYDDLAPYYAEVARRIGMVGDPEDDLAEVFPAHDGLEPPMPLDAHGQRLWDTYHRRRDRLRRLGARLGRSRTATLVRDRPDGRKACAKLGRCLWGCPTESLYTPWHTLRALMGRDGFEYRPGHYVRHLELSSEGRVRALVAEPVDGGPEVRVETERVALGAGCLSSSKIVLDSVHQSQGETWTLPGLMDNRQVLLPFVNLGMLRRRYEPDAYQYHQLNLGLVGDRPEHFVHGILTTLNTALVHPIVQSVPLDLRAAVDVFKHVHAALGLLNVNFWDDRRDTNTLTLDTTEARSRLRVRYAPSAAEPAHLRATLARYKRVLWGLGCVVPPGMAHVRPMGASVHYSGTIPMSAASAPRATTPTGRSHDFDNLWLVDGSTFPFLPAKNLTFTLMANARRIAHADFD